MKADEEEAAAKKTKKSSTPVLAKFTCRADAQEEANHQKLDEPGTDGSEALLTCFTYIFLLASLNTTRSCQI